jgi:hypothetical protein
MYDPEQNLMFEQQMEALFASTNVIRAELGDEHPLSKFCGAFDRALEFINQRRRDYDECFDEEERNKIGKEIRDMIAEIIPFWEDVTRKLNIS